MAAAGTKTIKATKSTRRVQEQQVPAELRGLYRDDQAAGDEAVSLDFTTEPTEDEDPVELEKLFSVDGVDYMIPKVFGPGVSMVYLDRLEDGRDIALAAVLKTVMGEDGWKAFLRLGELNRLSLPQLRKIMNMVQERTMGSLEATEGN